MGRKATGTVMSYVPARAGEPLGHYKIRVSLPDGSRPPVHLDPSPESPEHMKLAQKAAVEISKRLRVERAQGAPKTGHANASVRTIDDGMDDWVREWTAAKKRRGQTSMPENESHYTMYIRPIIPWHIRTWTKDDLRALSRDLDEKVQARVIKKWKTAANIWGTATKMSADSAFSKIDAIRVRDDDPSDGVQGPDRGPKTAKQYLFPSEFSQFIASDAPLPWRRAAALAVYLFPRRSELRMLLWEDVDLVHGTVHIHRSVDRNTGEEKATKTGVARRFSFERTILPLLEALHGESGGNGPVIKLPSDRDLSRGIRRWLLKAGVTRSELHTETPTRKRLTFHDLRATGLTWMAVRGDDPLKIMQRAGHTDFKTTQGYIREAEAVRDGFGDVFPPLPASLLGRENEPKPDALVLRGTDVERIVVNHFLHDAKPDGVLHHGVLDVEVDAHDAGHGDDDRPHDDDPNDDGPNAGALAIPAELRELVAEISSRILPNGSQVFETSAGRTGLERGSRSQRFGGKDRRSCARRPGRIAPAPHCSRPVATSRHPRRGGIRHGARTGDRRGHRGGRGGCGSSAR